LSSRGEKRKSAAADSPGEHLDALTLRKRKPTEKERGRRKRVRREVAQKKVVSDASRGSWDRSSSREKKKQTIERKEELLPKSSKRKGVLPPP